MNRRDSSATLQHWSWCISTKHEGATRAHPDNWKMKAKKFFPRFARTDRHYTPLCCCLLHPAPLLLTSSAASAMMLASESARTVHLVGQSTRTPGEWLQVATSCALFNSLNIPWLLLSMSPHQWRVLDILQGILHWLQNPLTPTERWSLIAHC